jgi:SAM-dependent methyltransferase
VLFSPACERNKGPILAMLQDWLHPGARVLEVGSGSGQHATFFCQQITGLTWQTSEREDNLADLQSQLAALGPGGLAAGSQLPPAIVLDVTDAGQWPRQSFDAVFSANTTHIVAASAVPLLLGGTARVLRPGGLLLLYGPFHDGGVHTAASNAAFDQHLRSLDPAMGVRDALELVEQAQGLGLEPRADVMMPANNRILVLQKR